MAEKALAISDPHLLALAEPAIDPILQKKIDNAKRMADSLEIESPEDYEASGLMRQMNASDMKTIDALLSPNINLLHNAHKAAIAFRDSILDPLEASDDVVAEKRKEYKAKMERIAAAAAAAQRQLAQKQATELANAQAKELERMGETKAAEVVRHQAATAPPPAVITRAPLPKTKGAVERKTYSFEITNPELVKKEYCPPSEKLIRGTVNDFGKKAESMVGGIVVTEDTNEHMRT